MAGEIELSGEELALYRWMTGEHDGSPTERVKLWELQLAAAMLRARGGSLHDAG